MDDIEFLLETKLQAIRSELKSDLDEIKKLIGSDKNAVDDTKLMDVFEVSQFLNVTCKSVRRYYSSNKLPGIKSASGRVHFKREDVEKFILNIQKDKYGIQRSE